MTGSLQIKGNIFYSVITYTDNNGKTKQKWQTTKLPVKGNKRNAEKILRERLLEFEKGNLPTQKIYFSEWLHQWLKGKERQIAPTTYDGYKDMIENHISPGFENITLEKLTAGILEDYYTTKQQEGLSPNTIAKHHAVIHSALKRAVKLEYISRNVAELADPPKRVKKATFQPYNMEELQNLLKAFQNDVLYPIVYLAAVFGLRRSEILGLRWDSLDLEKGNMEICSTALRCRKDGKVTVVISNTTKTDSSCRAFPLNQQQIDMFLSLKEKQELYSRIFGDEYSNEYKDFVFVDTYGKILQPDFITHRFGKELKKHGLRHIRFHDLRHSCATALLYLNYSMKDIQNWLGHSNYSFTADNYIHADEGIKTKMLNDMESICNGF